MSIIQYKYTVPGSPDSKRIIATYEHGILTKLEGIHLLSHFYENTCINAPIPLKESDVFAKAKHHEGLINVQQIKHTKTGEKIASFCSAYKKHTGINYIKRKNDVNIAKIPVTEDLLKLYFLNSEWWGKQPKSIANYATNINALMQLQTEPKIPKRNFPMDWSHEFERTLQSKDLNDYWRHLRQLGLKPVKRKGSSKTIKWVKATLVCSVFIVSFLGTSGCGFVKAINESLTNPAPDVIFTDTILHEVTLYDTIPISPDTLQTKLFNWSDFWTKQDTFIIENDKQKLEVIPIQISKPDSLFTQPNNRNNSIKGLKFISTIKPDTLPIMIRDTVEIEIEIEAACPPDYSSADYWLFATVAAIYSMILLFVRRKRTKA